MYRVIAVREGKIVRLKRDDRTEANRTAQALRDSGWTVSIRLLTPVGPFSAAYLGAK